MALVAMRPRPRNDNNEPTGVFASSGSLRGDQMFGTKERLHEARGCYTQQHGNGDVFEFFSG